MIKKSTVWIVIAAYNEEVSIKKVIDEAASKGYRVVTVNDGSKDATSDEVRKTSSALIVHPINLGQGAALQTGITYALENGAEFVVTYDADGQHRLQDVAVMLEALDANPDCDIALGSRFLGENAENIAFAKAVMLKAGTRFMNMVSGMKLTDTHNGLRVMRRRFAQKLDITMSDMAHASEIISFIADSGSTYMEVPVKIIYTDYSIATSSNPMMNSVNIMFDVVLNKLLTRKK